MLRFGCLCVQQFTRFAFLSQKTRSNGAVLRVELVHYAVFAGTASIDTLSLMGTVYNEGLEGYHQIFCCSALRISTRNLGKFIRRTPLVFSLVAVTDKFQSVVHTLAVVSFSKGDKQNGAVSIETDEEVGI